MPAQAGIHTQSHREAEANSGNSFTCPWFVRSGGFDVNLKIMLSIIGISYFGYGRGGFKSNDMAAAAFPASVNRARRNGNGLRFCKRAVCIRLIITS